MKISVKGKGVELTAALTDYVNNKFGKLERHSSLVSEIQITLSVEKLVQKAEANVIVPGAPLHCEVSDENMYAAIDLLEDKVDRIIVSHKEKITGK